MTSITQALLSVSDKTGIREFASALHEMGVKILSTGGTAKLLSESGIPVTEVGDYTGFPEMLDGRVKTLHPKIHGGILGRRDIPDHVETMKGADIPPIDLVVVNLYPFSQTVARENCSLEDAIENIDIGGPTMVRAAAKNYHHVAIVTDPADYGRVLAEMRENAGAVSDATRFDLAKKAFSHTASYDSAISNYLTAIEADGTRSEFPVQINFNFVRVQSMRYGENPHQQAAFYRDPVALPGGIASYVQVQGKELSYNNINDTDAAFECVAEFDRPAVVIVKHANPCGVALGADLAEAWDRALDCDPVSAFGGIIAVNRPLDVAAAEKMASIFSEVIIAPDAAPDAVELLARKKNLRLLLTGGLPDPAEPGLAWRSVAGGFLAQTRDAGRIGRDDLKVVTQRAPTNAEFADLLFAFRVAKHVKSNAIIYAKAGATTGIGAGQMSRVDSSRIAAQKGGEKIPGSVVASDAFFPFADGLVAAIEAGATAVIQPGGSIRDNEVIEAADAAGIAMVFTGMRHFRH